MTPLPVISAIIFDFDGTLTRPHGIDFEGIRRDIGCAPGESILEHIENLHDPDARQRAEEIIYRYEMEAAENAWPNDGAEDVVRALHAMEMPMAIVTRNIRPAVERAFRNFTAISPADFRLIVTRDDGVRPKPDPEAVVHIADTLGVPVAEILCVGDFLYDIELARNAGCLSVFLTNGENRTDVDPDFRIDHISELLEILRPAQG